MHALLIQFSRAELHYAMCMSHYYVSRMLHHHAKKWKFALIRETTDGNCSRVQVELTGNSIYEYIYPDDRNEMVSVLNLPQNPTDLASFTFPPPNSLGEIKLERAFLLRMKCILAKRNAGLVTEGYKVNKNNKTLYNSERFFGTKQKIYGNVPICDCNILDLVGFMTFRKN